MPISFHELTTLEFKEEPDLRYFLKSGPTANIDVKVQYIPIRASTGSDDRFNLYFFENSYLNAENDVFEVDFHGIEERLGWIFPITILESNDNDYENFKNLNDYKYVAYKKLLDLSLEYRGDEQKDFYSLTDFYPDCIVCLLCRDTLAKIPDFNFEATLLSFYDYGYIVLDNKKGHKGKAIFDRTEFVNKLRSSERKKIVLRLANFPVKENDFTKSLYKDHLLQSESHLIRFIFLYQIIEYLMQLEFDNRFSKHIKDYEEKKLGKNDLKEELMSASKERSLIADAFSKSKMQPELQQSFIQECSVLFDVIPKEVKANSSVSDIVYDLRNLITHQLRDLTRHDDQLKKIVEIFERLLTNLLIGHSGD